MMSSSFKVGDAVRWNSEAGEIHGKVVKVHTRDTEFMGRHRPALERRAAVRGQERQDRPPGHASRRRAEARLETCQSVGVGIRQLAGRA